MSPFMTIKKSACILSRRLVAPILTLSVFCSTIAAAELKTRPNIPEMIEADGKLRLDFSDEQLVLPRGLQPSMLCTKSGVFIVQAQVPEKPLPSPRMTYP